MQSSLQALASGSFWFAIVGFVLLPLAVEIVNPTFEPESVLFFE